jgi:hypothetical protein
MQPAKTIAKSIRGFFVSVFRGEPEQANIERSIWHKKPLGVFLLYFSIGLLAFWCIRTPSPGGAVAVLAVAAAAMTVLGEMKGAEKVAWILLLFGFVWVELTSIKAERKAQEEIQKEARAELLHHFGVIGDGINATIASSDKQFQETMGQLKRAVGNTESSAVIAFMRIVPATSPIVPNRPVKFNATFDNIGNENATDLRYDGRAYVGKLDDQETQKMFASEFDKWWMRSKHQGSKEAVSIPWSPASVFTFAQEFSDDEIKDVTKH